MKKYLGQYTSEFEKATNISLINKAYDRPLVEYLMDCFKSLEVMEQIKILGFDYTEDESKVDINDFIIKRTKKKPKKDRVNYKFIADERYGCLTTYVRITVDEPSTKDGHPVRRQAEFPVKMLVPIKDDDGYFTIKGKKYLMIYQLVDKSLYSTAQCVTVKSLMPISLKRATTTETDIHGNQYKFPMYNIFVFRKEINVLLFYATAGLNAAFQYLDVNNVIEFVDVDHADMNVIDSDTDNAYFRISSSVLLKVNKEMLDKYPYVKAITAMTLNISSNRLTMDAIDDKDYWLKKLGGVNSGKGESLKISFARLLDETTKKILRLEDSDKQNSHSLIRWIMMNFNELRHKDNLSLMNKRLRCNEYIASLLTKEFSARMMRVIAKGNKADLESYKEIFKFSGDILISAMHRSGILRFDENINDMDFFSKCRWSAKGPHSVGGKNSNNIAISQRAIYPSFLGYIDIIVSGNSDPGMSGIISPFTKLDSMYFNDEKEPNGFRYAFREDIARIMKQKGVDYIDIRVSNEADFYTVLDQIQTFNQNAITAYGASNDSYTIIIDNSGPNNPSGGTDGGDEADEMYEMAG